MNPVSVEAATEAPVVAQLPTERAEGGSVSGSPAAPSTALRPMRGHKGTRYPASSLRSDAARGVPKYAVLGPCPCQVCGTLLWFAHGQTRDGWNGPAIKGLLKWRELGGRIHTHVKAKNRPGAKAA